MPKLEFVVDQSCNKIILGSKEFMIEQNDQRNYAVHSVSGNIRHVVWLEFFPEYWKNKKPHAGTLVKEWTKNLDAYNSGIYVSAELMPAMFGGHIDDNNMFLMLSLPADRYSVSIERH
jgi:hypothetical protein